MDDLTAALAGSFQITSHANNPAAPHPRLCDYKVKTNTPNQQVRRERILQRQKEKRFDLQNHIRCLTEDDWKSDSEEEDEDMEIDNAITRPGRYYKNQLMLSEWMIEMPEDFETEWIMIPCPVGKRNLIIATKGETRAYSRSGFRIENFPSELPGGNRRMGKYDNEHTILDVIFNESSKTLYVLDLMCWHGHPVYDSETEFRMFWLNSKLMEAPEVKEWTQTNKYRIEALPNFSCTKENLTSVMASEMNLEMDGLLFYHKRTHYTFGPTPLVLWLKPYMLPDLLGIPIHQKYLESKPASYTGFSDHVEKVKNRKERSYTNGNTSCEKKNTKDCKSKNGSEMDTTNTSEQEQEIEIESGGTNIT